MIGDIFKIHQPQTNKLNKNENVTNYKYTAFAWYFQTVVGQKRNIIKSYSRRCSVGSIWGENVQWSNQPVSPIWKSSSSCISPPHCQWPHTAAGRSPSWRACSPGSLHTAWWWPVQKPSLVCSAFEKSKQSNICLLAVCFLTTRYYQVLYPMFLNRRC